MPPDSPLLTGLSAPVVGRPGLRVAPQRQVEQLGQLAECGRWLVIQIELSDRALSVLLGHRVPEVEDGAVVVGVITAGVVLFLFRR